VTELDRLKLVASLKVKSIGLDRDLFLSALQGYQCQIC